MNKHEKNPFLFKLLMRWRNVKLLQRLIIGCLLFLIIPILTASIVLFSLVFPLAQQESRDSMVGLINQLYENIQYRITGYQNILAQLAFDPRLSVALTQKYANLPNAVDSLQEINLLVQRINSYFPMRRIYIYKNNPTLPADWGSVFDLEEAYNTPWFKAMQSMRQQNFYWYFDFSNPGDPLLDVCTNLIEYWDNENYGLMRLEIPCQVIFDQLANPLQSRQGWIMLLDDKRHVLLDYLDKKVGDSADKASYLDEVYKNKKGLIFTKVNGKQSLVLYDTNDLGWKIVAVVSQEILWQKIQLIKYVAIVIIVLSMVLTIIVLVTFGLKITSRIRRLVKSMHEVCEGNLGLQVQVYGKDELADLETEFNSMSGQLDASLKNLAAARSLAEEEELRLLQAQINPHFLYNTLALVKYMAMDIGASDICSIIDSLSRFFRLALNRGSDILAVREELEHVRTYLNIYEQRYPNKVVVTYEISKDVLDCEIIKMTLQPIVENALNHAFVKSMGHGSIVIMAVRVEDDLVLRVVDNGCGMTDEMIERLQCEHICAKDRQGFGVNNVNMRLKRHFGNAYGLKITSNPGKGTTVEVRIPFRLKGGTVARILQDKDWGNLNDN